MASSHSQGIASTLDSEIKPALPGYPHPKPCLSFWLQGTGASPLLGHWTTQTLPEDVDVTIIGSGISGAAVAYFLLTGPNPPRKVVMLEAREACYGATGRNGGHCRPDCYRGYSEYKKSFGKEQAMKILQNEMDTLDLVSEVIEKEDIDCDFWRGQSFDVLMDEAIAESFHSSLKEFQADGGHTEGVVNWIDDAREAQIRTRTLGAVAAAEFPAASLYPYKLVQHLLLLCIDRHGLNLQTNTPVLSVTEDATHYVIRSERGVLRSQKVVYATNAFTSTLLPEFLGRITPFRGQCSAIVPTKTYAGPNMMTHTMCHYQGQDFDYTIQRPKDGVIIIGGGRGKVPIRELVGNTNDSATLPPITNHLKTAMKMYMRDWGEETLGGGLLVDWTGIMGYTPEAVPYVGAVHGKKNCFITAGHCGHGMARTFTCSRGIAAMVQGEPFESTGLPECFQPTPERLNKPRVSVEEQWYTASMKGEGTSH